MLKNLFPVIPKLPIRLRQLVRRPDRFARERDKILFQGRLRKEFFQALAQHDLQLFIQRDQPGIEGGIVQV